MQERTDWLEAMEHMKVRQTTLERTTRTLAQRLAQQSQTSQQHTAKIDIIDEDLIAYKKYVENVFYHDENSVKNAVVAMGDRIASNADQTGRDHCNTKLRD